MPTRSSPSPAAVAAVFAVSGAHAFADEPLRRVFVPADDPAIAAVGLGGLGFEVHGCGRPVRDRGVELVVAADELALLRARGFAPRTLELGRPFRDVQAEVPNGYPDLDGVHAAMDALTGAHPDLCVKVDLTAAYGVPPTFEGRHIFALKISDNASVDEDEPAVLIVSCHHAREIMTPVIALEAAERLLDGYGSDPRITDVVNAREIWIAPVWNPDGYNHVFTVDSFWRKNRRNNNNGTFGVDLNRNYPVGWSQCGGSQFTSAQTYEGPAAASEPETQTMIAFRDDRRFALVADVHSYASEVRYGYGCWNHPWESAQRDIARDLSIASDYGGDVASSCCLGGDIHAHTAGSGALAFLWETGTSFQPSFTIATAEADRVAPGLIELVTRPIPISGRVSANGLPVAAEIELVGVGFQHGEDHGSNPRTGLFHAHTPPGMYTLRVTADGFDPIEQPVAYTGTPIELDLSFGSPACNPGDIAAPFGLIDLADLDSFIGAFAAGDPVADLAAPLGFIDLSDIDAFIAAFLAGCP